MHIYIHIYKFGESLCHAKYGVSFFLSVKYILRSLVYIKGFDTLTFFNFFLEVLKK